jgi:hypothetical protein
MSALEFWLIAAATCGVMALAVVATLGILGVLPWQQGLPPQHVAALFPRWRDDDALRSDWDRRMKAVEQQRANTPDIALTFGGGHKQVALDGVNVSADVREWSWRIRAKPGDILRVVVFVVRDDTLDELPPEPGKDGIPSEWLRDIAPPGVRIVEEATK